MHDSSLACQSSEALLRATQHWGTRRPPAADGPARRAITIALSRETGAGGSAVGRELGTRLGWPVYDHQLLERIAQDMKLRVDLLKSVDEKHVEWLQECIQAFASSLPVSESSYVRHLHETLVSLSAHGDCIIVGRGAAQVLPPATTLRVRLIASREDRLRAVSDELGLSASEAARHIETSDRERIRFIREHFQKDPTDPLSYDLLLNTSRFSIGDCAALIAEALHRVSRAVAKG